MFAAFSKCNIYYAKINQLVTLYFNYNIYYIKISHVEVMLPEDLKLLGASLVRGLTSSNLSNSSSNSNNSRVNKNHDMSSGTNGRGET